MRVKSGLALIVLCSTGLWSVLAEEDVREPYVACGIERWGIKIGSDAQAPLIDLKQSQVTTVADMRLWQPPPTLPVDSRVAPFETTFLSVSANLISYRLEDDSDVHLVLMDPFGNTMIAEIPGPVCVGIGPFSPMISSARARFDSQFTATSFLKYINIPVIVSGIGFFDYVHGQTGVAPNGIEIHPVLDIVIGGTGPTPTPTQRPRHIPIMGPSRGLFGARHQNGDSPELPTPTPPPPTQTPTPSPTPTYTSTPGPTYTPTRPPSVTPTRTPTGTPDPITYCIPKPGAYCCYCKDGWISPSCGIQGACSGHGGIR